MADRHEPDGTTGWSRTMALSVKTLLAMTPGELDVATGLDVRGDNGWEEIVTRVRDEVTEANDYDRWDSGPGERDATVHELADSLVPTYTYQLMRELAMVGAAWDVDLEEARREAGAYMNHSNVTFGDSIEDAARLALYMAFRAAVTALVDTLDDEDDEDESDD